MFDAQTLKCISLRMRWSCSIYSYVHCSESSGMGGRGQLESLAGFVRNRAEYAGDISSLLSSPQNRYLVGFQLTVVGD
jgi:hypothetical protein